MEAARKPDPLRQREESLRRDQNRLAKNMDRLLTAYQEGLMSLDQRRGRMPVGNRRTGPVANRPAGFGGPPYASSRGIMPRNFGWGENMPETGVQTATVSKQAKRIGVLLVHDGQLNEDAARFLILQMNCLQSSFQYEFYESNREDPFLESLRGNAEVDRTRLGTHGPEFLKRYREFLARENREFGLTESSPDYFIILTLARLSENYYSVRHDGLAVIALGNWKRWMAPPSILEFILVLLVRESVAAVSPSLGRSVHLGTKGCLFDFTPDLRDVKFKVLHGFICQHCRTALESDHRQELIGELQQVLNKAWLGRVSTPGCPANILSKLGYNLFLSKGPKSTLWERCIETLQKDGIRELIKLTAGVILAGLLFWLGLNAK